MGQKTKCAFLSGYYLLASFTPIRVLHLVIESGMSVNSTCILILISTGSNANNLVKSWDEENFQLITENYSRYRH